MKVVRLAKILRPNTYQTKDSSRATARGRQCLSDMVISVPDVRERAKRRMKAEAKKMNKTHTANLSLTSGAIRP
jgi:hypothetical protein